MGNIIASESAWLSNLPEVSQLVNKGSGHLVKEMEITSQLRLFLAILHSLFKYIAQ